MDSASRHHAIINLLQSRSRGGMVSMAQLVEAALYAPGLGYYVSERVRVGKAAGTDFTTAPALGPMFGELIAGAARTLVGGDTSSYAMIEVGSEPGQSHFEGVRAKFSELRSFAFGSAPRFPARSVLVANELLDAQPFHRFIFQNQTWRELGVRVDGAELSIETLAEFSTELAEIFAGSLPDAAEGWIIDAPLAAENLLTRLLSGDWSGAVILLDYGKTIAQCLEDSPAGTARAYRGHQLSTAILENLGSQDLTCHVLWDRIEPILVRSGFGGVRLDRQEAFFVKNAGVEMERIAMSGDHEATGRLRALTHPAHFGAKFQVLYGVR